MEINYRVRDKRLHTATVGSFLSLVFLSFYRSFVTALHQSLEGILSATTVCVMRALHNFKYYFIKHASSCGLRELPRHLFRYSLVWRDLAVNTI